MLPAHHQRDHSSCPADKEGARPVVSAAPAPTPVSIPSGAAPPRTLRDVVFVEGVRTPFGKAGDKGQYAQTRADDLVVKVIRELLRRQPGLPPERIDEVAIAAATQTGDQGLTIGRSASHPLRAPPLRPRLRHRPHVRGCDDRCDHRRVRRDRLRRLRPRAIAGGVEHMGHHPMGVGCRPEPALPLRPKLVDPSGAEHGQRPRRTCTTVSRT